MKILLTFMILIPTTFGCVIKHVSKEEKTDTILRQVVSFPTISDTISFITELQQVFDIEVDEASEQKANKKITTYRKVKIYGSDNDYIFIEYDYGYGCMASFPWKYQLLLTTSGKLVKSFSSQRFDFVTIFPNQNPFLMTVFVTAKGNGGHEIYKISSDTLENVYEGYFDNTVRTYDAHQDNRFYEPNELILRIKDYNNDGVNDIAFVGKIVLIEGQTKNGDCFDSEMINEKLITYSVDNPFKKIPIEFIFLYDKQKGHFKAKEKYTEKYSLYN
jgi:hypothetical protein